ncbi:cytochrome c family protein [Fuchsiella alkaliacetigena]|uniref:cytochrome c family protein n=1 Tax=Fuchsiella alkaliacetigena TaxID=957042 RepID=UPI00200A38DE|nr:cytochrome c family protein [Fuchsiella alkaliacetigena]MCK8825123.1 cytochrome c family protein [Fuchsiella alkaliacetigena]
MSSKKFGLLIVIMLIGAVLVVGCQGDSLEEANKAESAEQMDLAEINSFEEGAFEDSNNCAGCHGEIHAEWSESMHRFGWENEFYQPDYLKASQETDGFTDVFCGECHAPTAVRTGQLPPADGSQFDAVSKQGISCDYCHTVKEVVEPVNVQTVSEPGDIKRGPRGDGSSPGHEIEYSEVHTEAAFCGSCHNVEHPTSEVAVIDTYDDWKEGPYAEEGIRCQDCHMTPTPGIAENPGKSSPMGEDREHIATHYFPGGSAFFHEKSGQDERAEMAKEMLRAAAELEAEATRNNDSLELLTTVNNVGAGHKIPTGVTYIRKMWLEVTVSNEAGEEIYTSGHEIADNQIDPEAVFYLKLFEDAEGNTTNKSWLAEDIAYDRRIPAQGSDEEIFEIPVETDEELDITVRLLYRSMSQEAADGFDSEEELKVPSIEMARKELQVE